MTCCLICCKKLRSLFTFNPANVQDLSSTVCQLLDLSTSTSSHYTGYFTTPSLCFSCHQKILQVQKLYDEIDEIKARIVEFKTEIGDGLIKGTCPEVDVDEGPGQEKRTRIAEDVKRSRSIGGTSTSTQTESDLGNTFELVFNLDGFEISCPSAGSTKEVTSASEGSLTPPEKSGQNQIENGFSDLNMPMPLFNIDDLSSTSAAPAEFESFKSSINSNLNFNFNFNPNSDNYTSTAIPKPRDIFDDDDDEYFQTPEINIDELDSILDQRNEENESQDQDPVQESNSNSSFTAINEVSNYLDDNIEEPEKSFDYFSKYVTPNPNNNTLKEEKDSLKVISTKNSKKNVDDSDDEVIIIDEPEPDCKSEIKKKHTNYVKLMKIKYEEEIKKSTSNLGPTRAQSFYQQGLFICNFCKMQMSSDEALLEHLTQVHEVKKKYKCPFPRCEKSFDNRLVFEKHKNIHTNIGNNFCPVCNNGTSFEDTYSLYRHIKGLHFPHLKRNRDRRQNGQLT